MSNTVFLRLPIRNALKRSDASGNTRLAAPATSAFSGSLYVTNYTIPHNLGYPPVFRYYYEPFKDGVIWPPLAARSNGSAQNPTNVAQNGPGIIGWVDSVAPYDLHLQLFYNSNTLTGTYPVYWTIYEDFHL